MSIPAFVCRATTSSTARHTRSSKAALSTGTPSSRAHIIAIRSSGRGRLPTCVVRKRPIVLLVNGGDGGNGITPLLNGGYGGNGITQRKRETEDEQRRHLVFSVRPPFLCFSVLYRFLRRLRYRALRALRALRAIRSLRSLQRREEVDADGCQLGRRTHRLEPAVGVQLRFPCAVPEDRQLDQILIRERVCAVVGDRRSLVQIGGGHGGRQRVQLQRDQAEPPDVRRPPAQVPHQIFLLLVRQDFLAEMGEGPRRPRPPR